MAWRSTNCKWVTVFLVLLACSAAGQVEDGPLVNGNFEIPPSGGFSTGNGFFEGTLEIPNWKINGTVELVESGQKQGGMILIIPQGRHAVRLGNDAELSQDLKVEKGSIYSVTFSAARTCAQLESLNLSVQPVSQTIDLQTLYSVHGWDSYTWAFQAEEDDVAVVFKNPDMEDDPTCGPIIDDIAIKKLFVPDKPKGDKNSNKYEFPNYKSQTSEKSSLEDEEHDPGYSILEGCHNTIKADDNMTSLKLTSSMASINYFLKIIIAGYFTPWVLL